MLEELKEGVCNANKELVKHGLVIFTWGNVSTINKERTIVAIKPSGVQYDSLTSDDIVLVDPEGNVVEGDKLPSSDTPSHLELYRNFKEINSVVHTHSTYATIFAQAKKPIICLGTTHADYFHGEIPVTRDMTEEEVQTDYELNTGKVIVEHFKKGKIKPLSMPACLMPSHGPFVWGNSIENALHNSVVLEQLARMNLASLGLNPELGPIKQFLLDKHYLRKHGKDAYYGQLKGK